MADLSSMNSAWEELVESVKEQGSKLGQAEAQKDYNLMTSDLQTKLADIGKLIRNDNVGDDMRDCKKLVSQHAAAEQAAQRRRAGADREHDGGEPQRHQQQHDHR